MNHPSAKAVSNNPETHESDENVDVPGAADTVSEKLDDIMTPGFQAEFDPEEAESAGAFSEDALSEDDALASTQDSAHIAPDSPPPKS